MTAAMTATDSRKGFLTIDVEDWYHALEENPSAWRRYEDRVVHSTTRVLELLAETGNRATFFVLGDVAARFPELVDAILRDGHEVGAHGHDHLRLTRIDAPRLREDLRRCLEALRAAGAKDVVSYRAPFFSLEPRDVDALRVLADEGIRIDSSVFPFRAGNYGANGVPDGPHQRGDVLEVPVTLPNVGGMRVPVTGGFYARFFPRWLSRWGLRNQFERGTHPVFYLHPWELDARQPRLPVGRFLAYRHYLRLERMDQVLGEMLRRYRWRPLADLLSRNTRGDRSSDGAEGSAS
jgi:polysaccharide deacetylase family protein (PEP-CTERM system associated)